MSDNLIDSALSKLFEYLRKVIYEPENASLVIEELPDKFREFGSGLKYYAECSIENNALASALSKGVLDGVLPSRGNDIAAPLKSLHSSLRHLTWQAQQIAQGDYNQRVAFMGNFADAFNLMVKQLAERERNLEDKINQIESKSAALVEGNLLLTTLVHYIPQQIFVVDRKTRKLLLKNDVAISELNKNPDYLDTIIHDISNHNDPEEMREIDIAYEHDGLKRFFIVNRFSLEWDNKDADVYVINDVSETQREIADLESHVYRDNLTNLFNRAYGMMTLDLWLHEKRKFVLVFVDLDSLKYINDIYGHSEGDVYIIRSGEHLKTFSSDSVACRIGGDEFMLLAPGYGFDDAYAKMNEIAENLRNDEYLHDKSYSYNMSYGIASVDSDTHMSAGDILGTADFRMYDNKQVNKKLYKKDRLSAKKSSD